MDRPPTDAARAVDRRVDRSVPGARWWAYERPARSPGAPAPNGSSRSSPLAPVALPVDPRRPGSTTARRPDVQSGKVEGILAAGLILLTIVATRAFGNESLGVVLIPAAGIAGAVAFGRRSLRVHPDEPWLPRILLYGTIAKLVAGYLRYLTLTTAYEGAGDATRYDRDGRLFVAAWTGDGVAPDLESLRGTNFMKWLTGHVYYLFGQNLLAGFLLFSLIALLGSYFWYRAFTQAVPEGDRRLFLIFMLFAPSIAFWPSSLGKEALMHFAVGGIAWVTALLLTGRFARAVPLMLGSGWLIWVVRPHLLGLLAVAGALPYFVGRINRAGSSSFLSRPIGMVVVGGLVVLSVGAGAQFVGIEDLSIDSIEAELDEQTASTSKGGSSFDAGSNSLNPVYLPIKMATVLFRPFPWETSSGLQLLAAAESVALIALIVWRFASIRDALRRARSDPFLLYCILLLVLYSMTFSSFGNFGLLTRQRSLVLPALYALIAVQPVVARRRGAGDLVRRPVRPAR